MIERQVKVVSLSDLDELFAKVPQGYSVEAEIDDEHPGGIVAMRIVESWPEKGQPRKRLDNIRYEMNGKLWREGMDQRRARRSKRAA